MTLGQDSSEYEIEVGENLEPSRCYCCGKKSCIGHGFVYRNGDAHAIYYVGWSEEHSETKMSIALAVGEWDDDSTSADRTCFGLEAYEDEKEILFKIINPKHSPWAHTELLGEMLSRDHALRHPLLKETLVIAEHIVRRHPAVSQYLNMPK